MPVFKVAVRRHRTETRLVIEECEVTVEAVSAEEVQAVLREAQEEGSLDCDTEWWTICTHPARTTASPPSWRSRAARRPNPARSRTSS